MNVKATFFVVGQQVLKHPEILLETYQNGHEICSHTWSHPMLTSLSTEMVVAELEYSLRVVQEVVGRRPDCFRPPFGDIDDRVRFIAASMGLKIYHWSYDTLDYTLSTSPFDIVSKVSMFASNWLQRPLGVISLQHDLEGFTVAKVPEILQVITKSGMKIMAVGDCLASPTNASTPTKSPSKVGNNSVSSMGSNCLPSMLLRYTLCLF